MKIGESKYIEIRTGIDLTDLKEAEGYILIPDEDTTASPVFLALSVLPGKRIAVMPPTSCTKSRVSVRMELMRLPVA
jgi:hypothetical protein